MEAKNGKGLGLLSNNHREGEIMTEKVTEQVKEKARNLAQFYYNSGDMLNDLRAEGSPEEQIINAYRMGMRFPTWLSPKRR